MNGQLITMSPGYHQAAHTPKDDLVIGLHAAAKYMVEFMEQAGSKYIDIRTAVMMFRGLRNQLAQLTGDAEPYTPDTSSRRLLDAVREAECAEVGNT